MKADLTCTDAEGENANERANSSRNHQCTRAHSIEGRSNLHPTNPVHEGVDREYPAKSRRRVFR